jgi:hypothetical protein
LGGDIAPNVCSDVATTCGRIPCHNSKTFYNHPEKVMMVMTVSTDQESRVQEDPKYFKLWISFYPRDDENPQPPELDIKVIMPQD